VEVTIVTADDDLRGHSRAVASIGLFGGKTLRFSLNSGESWARGSTHTVAMRLPAGTRLTDLATFRLGHEGVPDSSTEEYDTWKIAAVRLAFTTGQQCPVSLGSHAGSPLVALNEQRRSWETSLAVP
jgi:hypothetical protein